MNRATKALKRLSDTYRHRIERDQKIVEATFLVLLPAAASLNWKSATIVEPRSVKPSPVPFEPPFEMGNVRSLAAAPAPTFPDTNYRKVAVAVPPLGANFDDRVMQLEADARQARYAFRRRNDLMHKTQYLRPDFVAVRDALVKVAKHHQALVDDIVGKRTIAERLRSKQLAASDALHSETMRFVVYGAQSWIRENAKMAVLKNIVYELKEQDYYRRHTDAARTPILDVNESDILKYYEERKFNILNIPDGIQNAVGLRDIHNRITTLLTHAEGYAAEVSRLSAYGTESESRAFANEISKGLGKDSESLVKANLGAINIPEPFASIMAKRFLKN